MDRAAVPASSTAAVLFKDGLGERRHIADPAGNDTLELLCLRSELSSVPSFEFALRERVSRLSGFRHAQFGRARTVERTGEGMLAIVSERANGVRLSEMLVNADQRRHGLDITAALCLIRQLVPAMAAFHESARDAAHGTIGPERVVVTPGGQLVVMEYVLGAALEQLRYPREKYWSELRVALPSTQGVARFDQRADVTQMGVVALSLILGRPMRDDEYPARIADVVASTWAVSPRGGFEPLPAGLRGWLGRALQLDARTGFANAIEARAELEKMMGDLDANASQASLAAFLARYGGSAPTLVRPVAAAPPPQASAPPVRPPQPPAAPAPTPPRGMPIAAKPASQIETPAAANVTPPRGTPAAPAASAPIPAPVAAKPPAPPASVVHTTPPRGTSAAPPPPPASAVHTAPPRTSVAVPAPPAGAVPAAITPASGTPRPPTPTYGTSNPAIGGTPPAGTPKPATHATPPRGTQYSAQASAQALSSPRPPSPPPAPIAPPPAPVAPPPAYGAPPSLQFQSMAESVAVKPAPGPPRPAPRPTSSEIHQTSTMRIPKTMPAEIHQTSTMRIPQFQAPPSLEVEQTPPSWKKWGPMGAAVVVLVGLGAFVGRSYLASPPAATTGTVVFTTNPPGAQVVVDGQVRGVTPITLTVASGPHKVDLHGANASKTIAVSVAGGTQIAQYVELPQAAAAAAASAGHLQVRTEPAGAKVSVDGVARGTAPTTIADLAPGDHTVVLESDLGSIKQTVTIQAGVTASLVVPLAAPEGAPVSGWITVNSPVEMQLFEKDQLIGTSRTGRLMVAAGRHEIDIVNDDLGYRATRTLQVPAGKVASVSLEMPNGSIAINAAPWAEVWIDGNKVGETPIGNVNLPIGNHDVVFRHPELGERHQRATVSLKNVARLSVDLRKP